MLAQGQSSSGKGGGLAADIGSGLIFLKKKKKLSWLLFQQFLKLDIDFEGNYPIKLQIAPKQDNIERHCQPFTFWYEFLYNTASQRTI